MKKKTIIYKYIHTFLFRFQYFFSKKSGNNEICNQHKSTYTEFNTEERWWPQMQKEKKKWHFLFLLRNKRKANKRKDEYMTIRNSFGRPARSISLMVGIKLERHLWERNPILPFPRTEWSLLSSNSVRMPVSFRRKWKENLAWNKCWIFYQLKCLKDKLMQEHFRASVFQISGMRRVKMHIFQTIMTVIYLFISFSKNIWKEMSFSKRLVWFFYYSMSHKKKFIRQIS